MAGLPWIAAMAFFMQALDATILNTALPAIATVLIVLQRCSRPLSYTLTVAMLIPSAAGWRSLRHAPGLYHRRKPCSPRFPRLRLSSSLTNWSFSRNSGDRWGDDDAGGEAGLLRAYPRSELLPVLNFVTMPGLVGPILGPVLGGYL